jgi:hypothetical protein
MARIVLGVAFHAFLVDCDVDDILVDELHGILTYNLHDFLVYMLVSAWPSAGNTQNRTLLSRALHVYLSIIH